MCQGKLSLETLPDVLFVNNSGVHKVELGTVIRARCTASNSSAPIVVWFKDGDSLLNDPPHIRIRTSTDDTEVTSVLTIDNFNTGDNGDYYCHAYDSTTARNSTTLSLTGVYIYSGMKRDRCGCDAGKLSMEILLIILPKLMSDWTP